jgi:hypothetical protein
MKHKEMEEYIQIAKHIGPKYDFDKNDARQSNDIVEGDDVGHNYMPQYHSEQSADTIYQLDNSNDLSQYFTNPKSDVAKASIGLFFYSIDCINRYNLMASDTMFHNNSDLFLT